MVLHSRELSLGYNAASAQGQPSLLLSINGILLPASHSHRQLSSPSNLNLSFNHLLFITQGSESRGKARKIRGSMEMTFCCQVKAEDQGNESTAAQSPSQQEKERRLNPKQRQPSLLTSITFNKVKISKQGLGI